MGRAIKIFFSVGIIFLLIVFFVLGFQTAKSVDSKLASLETQIGVIDKKRESLTQKTLSLEEVKNNLSIRISLEKDLQAKLELQKSLSALKQAEEEKRAAELDALTQARAKAVEEARRLQQQALANSPTTKTVRRVTTVQAASAAPSTSSSGSAATTTPAPTPTPTPTPPPPPPPPPKVTSAS